MPFCIKCGKNLPDEAEFCFGCGAKVVVTEKNNPIAQEKNNSERREEWAGKVIKCPNCGDTIPSLTAICPSCGYELTSSQCSTALTEFIDQINACDYRIASEPNEKKGWSTWSKQQKTWWIILNVCLCCWPLIIYLCMPLIKSKKVPELSPEEKRKASLIENFPFPNDRQSILEALLFIKSKLSIISSSAINNQSAYWSNLWYSKGEQLYSKAQMLIKGDSVAEETHSDILKFRNDINKKLKKRAFKGGIIVIISIILIVGYAHSDNKPQNALKLPDTELARTLPPLENEAGKVVSETSDSLVIKYEDISSSEFRKYKKECSSKGFDTDVKEGDTFYEAENDDGYYIIINYSKPKMEVKVTKKE